MAIEAQYAAFLYFPQYRVKGIPVSLYHVGQVYQFARFSAILFFRPQVVECQCGWMSAISTLLTARRHLYRIGYLTIRNLVRSSHQFRPI